MKHRIALSLAACGCALTIATLPATADYTGIEWAELYQNPPAGVQVFGVYAVFDNPADRLLGVIGDANNPLHIWTDSPGGFHQVRSQDFGSDLAPGGASSKSTPCWCTTALSPSECRPAMKARIRPP